MGADHEAALLDEIRARPDDDGPRLVFADALADRGDPWGELIVAGCELARLAREGVVDAERRSALQDRCREIQQQRWEERSLTLDASLERGFCTSVELFHDGEATQVEGYEFAALREANLPVSGAALGALADCPLLGHIDRLMLSGKHRRHFPTRLEWAENLSACATALRKIGERARPASVELSYADLDGEGLNHLAASPLRESLKRFAVTHSPRTAINLGWPALEELTLHAVRLTSTDVERVLRRPALASLATLDLSYNAIGDAGMRAILDRELPGLRTLRILNTNQPESGAIALARSQLVRRLAALWVGEPHPEPTARALCALVEAAGQLTELAIEQRSLTAYGAAEIVHRLGEPLRKLRLRGGEDGVAMVSALASNPALRGLRSLDLSSQPLARAAVETLARAELPALECLDLSDCRLGPAGVDALARSETLPRRLTLLLRHNALPPSSFELLLARFHDVRF
ncbi:MAG TPA: TIGR02996 domain-containing protein [Kofleriaceae bacterium]